MTLRRYLLLLLAIVIPIALVDLALYRWVGPHHLISLYCVAWSTRCPILLGPLFFWIGWRARGGSPEWRLADARRSWIFCLGVLAGHVFAPVWVSDHVTSVAMPLWLAWSLVGAAVVVLAGIVSLRSVGRVAYRPVMPLCEMEPNPYTLTFQSQNGGRP